MSSITIINDGSVRHIVRNEQGIKVANFMRHENDSTISLALGEDGKANYVAQRHVPTLEATCERIERIFDATPLRDEIARLSELHSENLALWEEKNTTTARERYNSLGRHEIPNSNRQLEAQRDIVSAKIVLHLGIQPSMLRSLGIS